MIPRKQHQLGGWRRGRPSSYSIWSWSWSWRWLSIFRNLRNLLMLLAVLAVAPPFFFHFRLQRFQQMHMKKCGWLVNPPLVCAHGGDTTNAFPNTIAAYRHALQSQVDCIEIDVSASSDGILFALHDRDLQRITGSHTSRVGFLSSEEINELNRALESPDILGDKKILTIEDALMLVSGSVQQVILDAKVGPPAYERALAKNILAVVQRTQCMNCLVWAKSDTLLRNIITLSPNTSVGYVVMKDLSTGARSNLLRINRAGFVGIYHPLVDEKVVEILHRRNKKIYAWTVDDVKSMRNMLSKRVDAIITNDPTTLQYLMQDTRVECLEKGFSLP